MRSLEARIDALELRRPAPNVIFVVRYRPDGSIFPLGKGQVYGRKIALIPAVSKSVDEWLKRYVSDSWKDEEALMQKAIAALSKYSRERHGNQALANRTR